MHIIPAQVPIMKNARLCAAWTVLALLSLGGVLCSEDTIVTIAGGLPNDPLRADTGIPQAVVRGPDGTLYWSNGNRVVARRSDGTLAITAGTGEAGFSGDGGPAAAATLNFVRALAIDGKGNLYISDSGNNRVRKVATATGIITTCAGGGTSSADGVAATAAVVPAPYGLACDTAGNFYFGDLDRRVRRVDAGTGIISTIAGGSQPTSETGPGLDGDGGPAIAASLFNISALALNAAGDLFIAESQRVRVVRAATGIISAIAGNGGQGFAGDGDLATSAMLTNPQGLCVANSGDVYVVDTDNHRVRRISTNGVITTVAGTGVFGYNGDGILAVAATLFSPLGITLDGAANLYIADQYNHRIRRVAASTGLISTLAGNDSNGYSGDGSLATSTRFTRIGGIAYGPSGDLYIVAQGDHRICRVSAATGIVTTVAGTGKSGFSGDGGPATAADLSNPCRIAFDHAGNLLIVDQANHRIRMVSVATGIISTIAGSGNSSISANTGNGFSGDGGPATAAQFHEPVGLHVMASGDLLVTDMLNQRLRRISAATGIITTICGTGELPAGAFIVQGGFSGDGGPAVAAALNIPVDVEVDQAGNILIDDLLNNRIRRISAVDGTISTIAGNGTAVTTTAVGDGGPATAAILYNPTAISFDQRGDLIISVGNDNDALRRVDHLTGIITTIAGTSIRGFSGDGGPATLARLNRPSTSAIDPAGNLVFSDGDNFRVRKLIPVNLLAAEHPAAVQPGLDCKYVEGGWIALPDIGSLVPVATSVAARIDLTPRRRDTLYALRFTGYVSVPADGVWTFTTTSDDGSRLRIGGTLVVDNDGKHPAQERSGTIALAAGLHALTVDYFQNGGGETMAVTYAGPGVAKQEIPPSALVHGVAAAGPVLAITAPTAGTTWTTSVANLTVSGTASGAAGITTVDYALSGATTGAGHATGTAAWSFAAQLAPGQTLVTVSARDGAGQLAMRALTVTYSDLVPAEHPTSVLPGLAYAYAEGTWNTVPDFATLVPAATGVVAQPDLTPRRRDTLYALRFAGYLAVPADGAYTFTTTSDDGSTLAMGGALVVDNDGKHPAQQRSGTIGLQAGLHAIAIGYLQGGGGATLAVTWKGPGFAAQAIPASAFSHAQPPAGGILREFWTGVPGRTVASLTGWPAFPLAPSGTSLQTAFVAPSNWADNYGTRMRGYVTAPQSGAYTFWIAGDDQCELWLSPVTGLEHDKALIATVPSATVPLAWNTFPQQRSATVTLIAGQTYYIEALQKEAGGGDCLAVGWQLPDATFERPIPGTRLTPVLVGSASGGPLRR